ncbi:Putative electron transport protein YccM [Rubripirellula lacrimiformis]|uniref:Electron transport protein YccM n=1 Tax=Rubripirellula lacrimiformis TaxID=1930273 RepID=A0A517NA76_9BACT|nr:4Fe-4S binding protein [Rubripirellula lacrimiformis]QDT04036.1 Putative electron transport protein YccM [Rubripirellula lacrimiformis]
MNTIPATLAAVAGAILLIAALTLLDRNRTTARLRLDWFVPALRRRKTGQPSSHSLLGRVYQRIIPPSLRSDWQTKRRGVLRRGLRRLGISWLASPVRRVIQTVCLLIFLTQFLYVLWPYNSRPVDRDAGSIGWSIETIDEATGDVLLTRDDSNTIDEADKPPPQSPLRWLAHPDSSRNQAGPGVAVLGQFVITEVSPGWRRLEPGDEISAELLDAYISGRADLELRHHDPNGWPSHYADSLASKQWIPADLFLTIDPLVSLSTAIASRSWVASLISAAAILIVCLLIPRGFCGYLCPLGTTIDFFDWAVTRRTKRFQVPGDGWWVHIKYYLLAGTLVSAVLGVLVSGFVSAIPVITRACLFIAEPIQSGSLRGWHLVPSFHAGQWISIAMFAGVLCLGFMRPRFWCKYVCPSGALFSLGNLFRVTERKVESSCINCNKCVEICPFDAIKPDFTTRTTDCTMCQSCGGVCPTHAIKFVERWNVVELKVAGVPSTHETAIGRRGFLSLAGGTTAAVAGGVGIAAATKSWGANLSSPDAAGPVRPPGSVPEQDFLEMCIRCGECFKACPNNVLQPEGFQQGFEGLWTPLVNADWAGCESSCNACGQVCPTGAIRPLPLEEKRYARMGLAVVNESTCLPWAGREACDLCVQECDAAGYHAIEYAQVGTEADEQGLPIEGTGMLAPVVRSDACVGCGLCQTRCVAINVKDKGLLSESAIIVETGDGKEDRWTSGSYRDHHRNRNQPDTIESGSSKSGGATTDSTPHQLKNQQPETPPPTFDPSTLDPADNSSPF